jgi:hypothetical protein
MTCGFHLGAARLLAMLAVTICLRSNAQSSLVEARSNLEKWVETRQLISKTKSDWQTDKETLEQTVQLFERELKSVEEQMTKLSTNNTQVEKERLEAENLKKSSQEAIDSARDFAVGFEGQIKKLTPRFPGPLQDSLKPLLARLPADAHSKMSSAERVQIIVGVLNEVDKFNNAISVYNEKRKNPKGEEMAVEVLYAGLGAAYFVNETGDFAGTGTPGVTDWEWSTRPELASRVREAIRIYRNERPAQFISLPVTIK